MKYLRVTFDANNGISTTESNYIGKNVFSIPKLGILVKSIQTTKGRIIWITIIIVVLLSGFFLSDDEKSRGKRFKT